MKITTSIFLVLILLACSNNEFDDFTINSDVDSFLDFDIVDPTANNFMGQSYTVKSEQDFKYGTRVSKHDSRNNGVYLQMKSLSEDSLFVNTSLRFQLEQSELSTFEIFEIQFVYAESKDNLRQLNENTFTYFANKNLFQTLKEYDWSKSDPMDANRIIFRIPYAETPFADGRGVVSQGFYHGHQNFDLNAIEYDATTDQITIEGNFNLYVTDFGKFVMGCGYGTYYHINDANFFAQID